MIGIGVLVFGLIFAIGLAMILAEKLELSIF